MISLIWPTEKYFLPQSKWKTFIKSLLPLSGVAAKTVVGSKPTSITMLSNALIIRFLINKNPP